MIRIRIAILIIILCIFIGEINGKGVTGWGIFRKLTSPKVKSTTVTAVMGVRGDLSGVVYNPAVLGYNLNREIYLISELSMINEYFGGIIYGHPFKESSIGIGLLYYNAGKMELSWFDGLELKTEDVIAQQDFFIAGGYGFQIKENFTVGLNIKIATSSLFEQASAISFAGDIGINYSPIFIPNLSIAGAVQNIGKATKFVNKSNPLPFSVFGAIGYLIELGRKTSEYYITPGIDFTYIFDDKETGIGFGIEVGIKSLFIDFGYNTGDEGNYKFGIGYITPRYDIAYGFQPGINLSSVHRISIGFRF